MAFSQNLVEYVVKTFNLVLNSKKKIPRTICSLLFGRNFIELLMKNIEHFVLIIFKIPNS